MEKKTWIQKLWDYVEGMDKDDREKFLKKCCNKIEKKHGYSKTK